MQKGRTIHEDIAQDLLKRGLIESEAPHYSISLSIAKNTNQLPSYTKTKGLDKERLRQMVLQYLSNAGEEGAKRDSIYEYLKDVLPANKTEEQQLAHAWRFTKSHENGRTDKNRWTELVSSVKEPSKFDENDVIPSKIRHNSTEIIAKATYYSVRRQKADRFS